MQQRLKSTARAARAEVVPSELLDELLLAAVNRAFTPLDVGLGGEASTALARALERRKEDWSDRSVP